MSRILIAGIGNIFCGDDGFACEVIRRLEAQPLPAGVDAVDFGIRALDLGYALQDPYELVVLVDIVDRDGAPGSVYLMEPALDGPAIAPGSAAMHEMDLGTVLGIVAALGEDRPQVLLVGCQPDYLGGEEGHLGLSAAVEAAVPVAVAQVREIIEGRLANDPRYVGAMVEGEPIGVRSPRED